MCNREKSEAAYKAVMAYRLRNPTVNIENCCKAIGVGKDYYYSGKKYLGAPNTKRNDSKENGFTKKPRRKYKRAPVEMLTIPVQESTNDRIVAIYGNRNEVMQAIRELL